MGLAMLAPKMRRNQPVTAAPLAQARSGRANAMVPTPSCVQFGAVSTLFCNRTTGAIHMHRDFFPEPLPPIESNSTA
jgi:hypothetical protein